MSWPSSSRHRNELPSSTDDHGAPGAFTLVTAFLAHLVGYVGEVSEDMLSLPQWSCNNPGDVVGKSGWNSIQSITYGKERSRQAVVNSKARKIQQLARLPQSLAAAEADRRP